MVAIEESERRTVAVVSSFVVVYDVYVCKFVLLLGFVLLWVLGIVT